MNKIHVFFVGFGLAITATSLALASTSVTGKVNEVYNDPDGVVIYMDVNGPCGSPVFYASPATMNVEAFLQSAQSAKSGGSQITVKVDGCNEAKNLLTSST